MGLLTGKYSSDVTFPEGDFRRAWIEDEAQNAQFRQDLETLEKLKEVVPAEDTMAAIALRFVTSHPAVSVVIPGARNRRQAEANVAAGSRPTLTPEEQAAVDSVVAPGGGRKIWPEVT
jgi:aryl-alcohol dehydrogenase-like predicted oxidoreductase